MSLERPSESGENSEESPTPEKPEEVFETIRKKAGKIARGAAIIGVLATTEPGDKVEIAHYQPGKEYSSQPTEFAVGVTEKKLSQKDYLELCGSDPEKAFVTASLYRNEPWIGDALKEIAEESPYYALEYADRYQGIPAYDSIISIAVNGVEQRYDSSAPYAPGISYTLSEYTHAWIHTPLAHDLIQKISNESPASIIEGFRIFAQSQEGYEVGKQIIESSIKLNSYWVLRCFNQFDDQPWAENVIRGIAAYNPIAFLEEVGPSFGVGNESYYHSAIPESLKDELVLDIARKRPDLAITFLITFENPPATNSPGVPREDRQFLNFLKNGDKNLAIISKIHEMHANQKIVQHEAYDLGALAGPLSSGQLTMEDALTAIKNPIRYSELLLKIIKDTTAPAREAAEAHLGKTELEIVKKINDLHESRDAERFASVEHMDAEKLYFLMVYGEEEVFTSTFNGLFNRMLVNMGKEGISGKQLLERASFNGFRTLIRMCTEFNRFDDFLKTSPEEDQEQIIRRFAGNLGSAQDPLREAVSVAEAINSLNNQKTMGVIESEIKFQLASEQKDNMKILYKLIAATFKDKGGDEGWLKQIEREYQIPSLTEVKSTELFSANQNIQEYFFYNDEDGHASFSNFVGEYKNKPNWNIEDHGTYIVIHSENGPRGLKMYANKPEEEQEGPDDIAKEFTKLNVKTIVVVHRGHSYHAQKTIERIPSIAKIVSLGSCGGYRNLSEVLKRAPNAHIISTKGTGTKFVNDPLFKMLNEEILSGHDIKWSEFWKHAEQKLGGQEKFRDYVPPHKNFGAMFIKAYEQATKSAQEVTH